MNNCLLLLEYILVNKRRIDMVNVILERNVHTYGQIVYYDDL